MTKPIPWHVMPVDDLYEHESTAHCWCVPRLDPVLTNAGTTNYVIVHTAADGRDGGRCEVRQ